MKWEIAFDGIPPGPNDRLHFRQLARIKKHWRTVAALKAVEAGIPHLQRARLTVRVLRRNLGVADPDNDLARAKAICDGIVDAGVLPGDSRKYVEWAPATEEHGPPGFVLVIETVED